MKWYILALKKYATFSGRSRRKEFWMFVLFYIIFYIVAIILDHLLGLNWSPTGGGLIASLFSLAMLVPTVAVHVRRFHDIGKSGWYYVLFFLGYVVSTIIFAIKIAALAIAAGFSPTEMDPAVVMQFATPFLVWFLVMLILSITLIYLMAKDSKPGPNKWGPNPKEPEITDFTSFQ
ncbi:MAG: DUF805 domain-containing protein [Taibaiella sp.]|nr:DUF805 domain-containing protein [Taibaiella sp.]